MNGARQGNAVAHARPVLLRGGARGSGFFCHPCAFFVLGLFPGAIFFHSNQLLKWEICIDRHLGAYPRTCARLFWPKFLGFFPLLLTEFRLIFHERLFLSIEALCMGLQTLTSSGRTSYLKPTNLLLK